MSKRADTWEAVNTLFNEEDKWIGEELQDWGDAHDKIIFKDQIPMRTSITGMKMEIDYFEITGKDFSCGNRIRDLIIIIHNDDKVELRGFNEHQFSIERKGGKT